MDGINLTELWTTIGGVLGTPAALFLFYLYNKVKELEKRINDGTSRFDKIEAELQTTNKLLYNIMGKVDSLLRQSGHTPE